MGVFGRDGHPIATALEVDFGAVFCSKARHNCVLQFVPRYGTIPRELDHVGILFAQHARAWIRSCVMKDTGVKQIEKAITQLPAEDLAELMSWLEDYHAGVWDQRIEEDLATGRLDALLAEVDKEYEAGLSRPL